MEVKTVVLEGKVVRLEPMSLDHLDGLCEVGLDESLWTLIPTKVASREDMFAYIESALADRDRGVALPFVTIEKDTGKVIGSTRFGNIYIAHLRTEIGWTWIAPAWQRSRVNTEAKLLMLTHAFETWGCIRVEFKTDSLNQSSHRAIQRIGATEEGVFRNHMITLSGRFRHSVYFSIIEAEWESVRTLLRSKLDL